MAEAEMIVVETGETLMCEFEMRETDKLSMGRAETIKSKAETGEMETEMGIAVSEIDTGMAETVTQMDEMSRSETESEI